MKVVYFISLSLFLICLASCKKSTEPIGNENPPIGFQKDVQWPSLADSPWPMAHHDPQNTGRSNFWGPSSGIISWEYEEAYKMVNSIVLGPDSTAYILIPPGNGGLFAFKPDGTIKWKLNILAVAFNYTTPIITSDGTIFCYDGNRTVFAVNPEGSINYTFNLETTTGTPTFAIDKEGNFYFVDFNKTLYVIDQEGNVQWTLQDDLFNNWSTYPSFSPDGNTLYIIGYGPTLSAVDITSRQIRWRFQSDFGSVFGAVVDSYGNIYFLTQRTYQEAEMFALKPNGEIKWSFKIRSSNLRIKVNIPTIDKNGNLYFATDSLYSLDFQGNLNWKRDLNNNISDCPLICDYNGSVYIGARGAQMSLIAFNSSGDLLWEINDLQNGVGGSPAIGFSELLYFPTWESEKIYCIK